MISKKHFLNQIEKLNDIFPEQKLSDIQAHIYYETLSPDFTDEAFTQQLNYVLKNNFKFPPIAAFYKIDSSNYDKLCVTTSADEERLAKAMAKYEE